MPTAASLMTALNFSAADLAANRQGQLSAAQIAARKKSARNSALLGLVIIGIFFAFCAIMLVTIGSAVLPLAGSANAGALVGLAVPGVFCVLLGLAMLSSLRSLLFPRTPTLRSLTGTIVPGNRTRSSQVHEIEINGIALKVSGDVYALIDPARTYTLYLALFDTTGANVYRDSENAAIVGIEESRPEQADSSKSPADYERETLERLFSFDPADLAANRAGRFSPEQIERLRENIGNGVGCGIFMGVFFGVFPLTFISGFTGNILAGVGVAVAVFLFVLVVAIRSARSQQRQFSATLDNGPAVTSGEAAVRISVIHHTGKHHHDETVYHVRIGEKDFRVSEEAYYAFKEGRPYRVYYATAVNDRIVSAEQIG